MHGYQLRAVLEEGISTFWPVHLAAIYPGLRGLEEEGLVRHHAEVAAPGRPNRKVYEISASGREELSRWRRLPPEDPRPARVPLFLKLFFAKDENLPDAVGWIEKEMESMRGAVGSLQADLSDPNAFSTLVIRFLRECGLAHAELQLDLLQDLRARVLKRIDQVSELDENGNALPPDDRQDRVS